MKRPSSDDLFLAANWLDVFESAEDKEACERVRKWLLAQAEESEFRQACKAAGVSVSIARKARMMKK